MKQLQNYSKFTVTAQRQRRLSFAPNILEDRNQNQSPTQVYQTSSRRKLLIIFLINYLILGQAYNSIPFIFAQPYFFCHTENSESYECTQKQACLLAQKYHSQGKSQDKDFQPFQVRTKFDTPSFITEYQLYCDKKIIGANYQSINFIGHLIASIALVIISGRIVVSKFIYYASISCFAVGILAIVSYFSDLQLLQIMFFAWAFFIQIPHSLIPSAIPYYFEQKKLGQYFAMTHLFFPMYCVFNPFFFSLCSDWRSFLFWIIGIPSIILGYIYKRIDGQVQLIKVSAHQLKLEQKDQLGIIQILKSQYAVPLLALVMVSFYPYFNQVSVTMALNSISGDFTFNFVLSTLLQIFFSAVGLICLRYFRARHLILFFFSLNSILFILSSFMPEYLQTPVLLVGKGCSDALWGVISVYICQVLPRKCMMPINSLRFCFMLFMPPFIPYINYLGWLWDINIFLIIGLFQWTGFYFVYLAQKSERALLE